MDWKHNVNYCIYNDRHSHVIINGACLEMKCPHPLIVLQFHPNYHHM